jgi:hypothetical protein
MFRTAMSDGATAQIGKEVTVGLISTCGACSRAAIQLGRR